MVFQQFQFTIGGDVSTATWTTRFPIAPVSGVGDSMIDSRTNKLTGDGCRTRLRHLSPSNLMDRPLVGALEVLPMVLKRRL